MTKKDAVVKNAQDYANLIKNSVYVYRRGDTYKASQNLNMPGWKLAEIVRPQ